MITHRWTILADGTHVVDPQGWTIAKFYGDDADEHARIAVAAVNSHARLLAAAKEAVNGNHIDPLSNDMIALKSAIAAAEEMKP